MLDLVHLFNDTFRYLDDIRSIDNTEFERTLDIYTAELQRNKAKNHPVIVNEIAPPRTSKIKVYLYYLICCPIIGKSV